MLAIADTDRKVRATRAYLAGFGTSGSLLVGAAAMFVLASAIVAFHGWPQVASQAPIAHVSAPLLNVASGSRAGRILQAALSPRGGAAGGGAATAAGTRAGGGVRTTTTALGPGAAPGAGTQTAAGLNDPNATTRPSATCTSPACDSAVSTSVPVNAVSTSLGKTVSSTGAQVGSSISGTSGSVGKTVSTVSPSAGSAVQNGGSSAGQAVTTTASQVGSTLSGGGHAVSRLTGP